MNLTSFDPSDPSASIFLPNSLHRPTPQGPPTIPSVPIASRQNFPLTNPSSVNGSQSLYGQHKQFGLQLNQQQQRLYSTQREIHHQRQQFTSYGVINGPGQRMNQNNQRPQQSIPVSSVNQPQPRRLLKMSFEDKMKLHQVLINTRKMLIESGKLRKEAKEQTYGFFSSTLRKLNSKKSDKELNLKNGMNALREIVSRKEFEDETFKHFPHYYWAYSKFPLNNSLLLISDSDLELESLTNFNSILEYSGLYNPSNPEMIDPEQYGTLTKDGKNSIYGVPCSTSQYGNTNYQNNSPEIIKLAQLIIERSVRKEVPDIFKNEFFLQLIKQTTDHPEPNSVVNIRHWQLLALACSITYPTDRRILAYLHAHLRKCSLDEVTEEGSYARFTLKNLQGTLETRGRKLGPSKIEINSTIYCRRVYARIHFLDGQFQAVEFDSCATISEVIEQIQIKIGLRPGCPGYALYQTLGTSGIEQALIPTEKVGDAITYWEKWHEQNSKSSMAQRTAGLINHGAAQSPGQFTVAGGGGGNTGNTPSNHYFIFKKHLFLESFIDLNNDKIERELIFHQIVHKIRMDKFPISSLEAVMLCALKAQLYLGDFDDENQESKGSESGGIPVPTSTQLSVLRSIMINCLPPRR